ncbi:AMP-dependent synthetase and ligase, putative [Bodo saltans]|uniref:AMP-dependent synthetase and ligase, putative n=1 Tax=Bodo saltans TaxID=75058 RepID=A0A0S4KJT4_BODSA|nr:AMP-dependent synthetase and ligase, putative [Bodo saltans]|eukprot:CUI14662.1 AMP-dependent synthetase and ligase, putative [Bodo saltans]
MLRRIIPSKALKPTLLCCVRMEFTSSHTKSPHSLMFTRADVRRAADDPDGYWGDAAKRIEFFTPPAHVSPPLLDDSTTSVGQWFRGGKTNVCYNAVDRHAAANPDKVAIYFDSPVTGVAEVITYGTLLQKVSAVATVLAHEFGVRKGDCVIIYMPNVPEAVYTMLACARIGAVHSVVFGGFAPKELSKRIVDSNAAVVITTSCGIDRTKLLNYKALVDSAIEQLPDPMQVKHCGVWVRKELKDVAMKARRDWDMNSLVQRRLSEPLSSAPPCVPLDSSDPFYILYTSGTTGTPKGIVRDTASTAVVLAHQTEKFLGVGRDEVVFTASDIGWIVGTNFIVYGPLLHGCSTVLYEGKPIGTPDAGAFFRIFEQYRTSVLFTAPTALRAIKGVDPEGVFAKKYDTSALKRIYLGGERTDPNSVHWTVDLLKVPVIDNWWQTETGSPITAAPYNPQTGAVEFYAGSCGIPCPGWYLEVKETESVHHGDEGSGIGGELMIKLPLPPGALSGIWGRPTAVKDVYLKTTGYFATFDAGEIDANGFVSVMARTDDIINVAGHRLSTGQMEAVLCEHAAVAEAAVVGMPCGLRGEKPLGLVVVKKGSSFSSTTELEQFVRSHVGPIAIIDVVFVEALPKTRSGKVLRRTIRKIAAKDASLDIPATIEDNTVIPKIWEAIHKEPMPSSYGFSDFALDVLGGLTL